MDNKKKGIIIGAIVLALLVVALVFLLLNPVENTDDDTSSNTTSDTTSDVTDEDESYSIIEKEVDLLKNITLVNGDKSSVIKPVDDGEWIMPEVYDYNASYATSDVTTLCSLHARKIVTESTNDLAQYGLAEPKVKAILEFEDETITLYIGDETIDENLTYARINDEPEIFTVSTTTADIIRKDYLSYINLGLIAPYDTEDQTATPTIEEFSMERKDLLEKVTLERISAEEIAASELPSMSNLKMTSPVEADVEFEVEGSYVLTLFGLTAKQAVAINANSPEVMAKYGFDDPYAKIEFEYDSKEVELVFGDALDSSASQYYMTFNDNNIVYVVNASNISVLKVSPNEFISSLLILPNIASVETTTLNLDGKEYVFESTIVQPEPKKDEDGKEVAQRPEVSKVTYNGENLKVDYYKKFYQLLLSVSIEGINYVEPTTEPVMTIEYDYANKDSDSDTVLIYDEGNRKMLVGLNSGAGFEGRIAYLEKIRQELQNLLDGNPVDTSW